MSTKKLDPESIISGRIISSETSRKELEESSGIVLPEVTVFEHRDFDGDSWRTTFGYSYVGDDWNDRISSIIVHSGYFEFYEHANFGSEHWGPVRFGPGHYPFVGDYGIWNDTISSWKAYYGS